MARIGVAVSIDLDFTLFLLRYLIVFGRNIIEHDVSRCEASSS
jgi:hypothetical protein